MYYDEDSQREGRRKYEGQTTFCVPGVHHFYFVIFEILMVYIVAGQTAWVYSREALYRRIILLSTN
jgi:hypothetical protein